MTRFTAIVAFVTAMTLWVGGALGIFLITLSVAFLVVYGPDWSRL